MVSRPGAHGVSASTGIGLGKQETKEIDLTSYIDRGGFLSDLSRLDREQVPQLFLSYMKRGVSLKIQEKEATKRSQIA